MENAPELFNIPFVTWGPSTILAFVAVLFFTGRIVPSKHMHDEIKYWRQAFFQVSDQLTKVTNERSVGTQAIQRIAEKVEQDV